MDIAYFDKDDFYRENFKHLSAEIDEIDSVECFSDEENLKEYIKFNKIKMIFMEIDWEIVKKLRGIDEGIIIVFVTRDKKQALSAYQKGIFAYVLKPCTAFDIREVIIRYKKILDIRNVKDIKIKTFGRFDIFVGGETLIFKNKKAKELLALLVDHRGGVVTMDETIDVLWEDRLPDDKTKALYRIAVKNLRDTLKAAGCDDILIESRGQRAIDFKRIDCDYYKFYNNPVKNKHLFNGDYMTEYSWGEYTLAKLFAKFKA